MTHLSRNQPAIKRLWSSAPLPDDVEFDDTDFDSATMCPDCAGNGIVRDGSGFYVDCQHCDGSGVGS